MSHKAITCRFRSLAFILLCLSPSFLLFANFNWNWVIPVSYNKDDQFSIDGQYVSCRNALERMITGHWSLRNYTVQELKDVEDGVRRQRKFYKIPANVERKDKKCGSVTFEGLYWHRALCDPKGPTPCCNNNICVNKSVSECQCPQCYDMRSKIHAELADWIPDDTTCKILKFETETQVCSVLHNVTLYFIGDSYMRQLCISALNLIFKDEPQKVFKENTSNANQSICDKHYRYVTGCSKYIQTDVLTCHNTTRIFYQEIWFSNKVNDVLKSFRELLGKQNSWFIFGIGAHDRFNFDYIRKKMIVPLLNETKRSDWPKLVWYEPHADGLLKTPNVPAQLGPNRIKYNVKVKEIMDTHNVPVLSFYNMTSGVVSYDGSHYGKGVNDIKFQILLNYLLETRSKLRKKWFMYSYKFL